MSNDYKLSDISSFLSSAQARIGRDPNYTVVHFVAPVNDDGEAFVMTVAIANSPEEHPVVALSRFTRDNLRHLQHNSSLGVDEGGAALLHRARRLVSSYLEVLCEYAITRRADFNFPKPRQEAGPEL